MYESKATVTLIRATSRASVKIRDNFYTVEWSEEHSLPDSPEVDYEEERRILWDICNREVDNQIEEILQTFSRK